MTDEKRTAADRENLLDVHMLGEFSVYYQGKKLNFKCGNSTKAMQILQLLLSGYPQSISKTSILEKVFEYDDILNPNNNLKVSISQLRSYLGACGLPCDEFIRFKSNSYFWSCPLPLQRDTDLFEQAAKSAEDAKSDSDCLQHCVKAVGLYCGNFLPELVGIDWVEKLAAYYYELFADVVRRMTRIYMAREQYDEAFAVFGTAFERRHAEEWQIGRIECMMKLNQWETAKTIYQETVSSLEKEFSVGPSEQLLETYRIISEKTDNAVSSFENMLSSVKESSRTKGAYYCAFPGFVDSCRVLSRNMERSGISCYLMMLFLGDSKDKVLHNEQRLTEGSEALFNAIQSSLRRGDSFTQYNKSQFLVFLFGTSRENCDLVASRIISNFKKYAVRGAQIRYEVTSGILDQLENFD